MTRMEKVIVEYKCLFLELVQDALDNGYSLYGNPFFDDIMGASMQAVVKYK